MCDGFIITEGIAYAKAVIFKNEPITVSQKNINQTDVEHEIALYNNAKERTHQLLITEKLKSTSEVARDFIETAILYLIDPYITEQITTEIAVEFVSAESAIMNCYNNYLNELIDKHDPFVSHNEYEIRNLAETLILELRKTKLVLPQITEDSILITNNITPAQLLTLDLNKIKGILLENGNTNSHLAIVLRSTKIPAIFNVNNATTIISSSTMVLIDAYNNHIYLNPDEEVIWNVKQKVQNLVQGDEIIKPMIAKYRTLEDGTIIKVLANISSIAELNKLKYYPSSGIGLFRTEFLFMNYTKEPSEEEQFITYKQILNALPKKYTVNFRTFDFNADKLPLYMTSQSAFSVGKNTIGSTTTHVLIRQIRALLRASAFGTIKIMFPMVSEYDELKELVELFNSVYDNLIEEGCDIPKVPIGIMIETPAGALMSKELATLVDFFSIGTNDLTQYTEAINREVANHRNNELTPAVLKLILLTVKNAKAAKIDVSICGEIVQNLEYFPILMGIGLTDFSVAPLCLSKLLDTIHSTDINIPDNIENKIQSIKSKNDIIKLSNNLLQTSEDNFL